MTRPAEQLLPAAQLLPHQPPMRLIEHVLAYDDRQLWATTAVAQIPFTLDGELRACYGLELMAQTAAAYFTLRAGSDAQPRQGMLIACRKFDTAKAAYPAAATLLIHAQLQSSLPTNAGSSALVKFGGTIRVIDAADALPVEPEQLSALSSRNIVSTASLSVYI